MRRLLLAVPLVAAALAAGCGSSSSGGAPPKAPPPSGNAAAFPQGITSFAQLATKVTATGPVMRNSVSLLEPGTNRMSVGLFTPGGKQILGAPLAIYTVNRKGTDMKGPFVARQESLVVDSAYQSQTTAQDPAAAKGIYVADLPFPKKGLTGIIGVAQIGGKLVRTNPVGLQVGEKGAHPPDVGQKAIRVHTPTLTSVGGDAKKIDTRVPPAKDLLQTDLYSVLGKRPVVITFATPQLCQSRLCGPVVDVVEQARAKYGAQAAFVHQEIYNDNQIAKGYRPQVGAWHLPSEPWTFVIDKRGIVRTRFEGAFSVGELERAIARVV